jgi:hypothetical protein
LQSAANPSLLIFPVCGKSTGNFHHFQVGNGRIQPQCTVVIANLSHSSHDLNFITGN